jgi:amino acid transporter
MGAFRRQVPEAERPYRMPGAAILCPAAFCVADLLIYWSGFEVVWKLGIVLVIGYWQGVYSGQSSKTPLPPVNTGHLHFWWDMLVVIVFSVAIYFWAMHSRLPREKMLALVAEQSSHDDPLADIHE